MPMWYFGAHLLATSTQRTQRYNFGLQEKGSLKGLEAPVIFTLTGRLSCPKITKGSLRRLKSAATLNFPSRGGRGLRGGGKRT